MNEIAYTQSMICNKKKEKNAKIYDRVVLIEKGPTRPQGRCAL